MIMPLLLHGTALEAAPHAGAVRDDPGGAAATVQPLLLHSLLQVCVGGVFACMHALDFDTFVDGGMQGTSRIASSCSCALSSRRWGQAHAWHVYPICMHAGSSNCPNSLELAACLLLNRWDEILAT